MKMWKKLRSVFMLASFALVTGSAWPQAKPGIVIEEVLKSAEAEKAGVHEGDVLLRWSRGDARGEISSPFDLLLVEIEQAPLGDVTLDGIRGEEKRVWVIGADDWGLKTRPQ